MRQRNDSKRIKFCYVVNASDRRERGNFAVKYEIAEPVPNEERNPAPSSLALLGTAALLAMTQE